MSRIMEELYETAVGLHASGVVDKQGMREIEALYRAQQVPEYTGEQVREIRDRLNLSEIGFASVISTSKNTIRAWEEGKSKPRGPARRLLDILNRKGLEALL